MTYRIIFRSLTKQVLETLILMISLNSFKWIHSIIKLLICVRKTKWNSKTINF